ncbi:hypothetical protein Asppvi_002042 [Aspergillus pseudoviridinutans]|uniref:Uncharacterized protein n=1 Tax=Aspergillus pseudoviridinutans TaxID=1517512 RepID=A0A9P3BLK9_9EURO|nr:uncharacterized protein Asppvi_002042 [Aspergillus pseudoviridinutans]GIJ92764.1 hypothetical protein Asppvi_002042 [Aspergillus pseudoviridinutans]
MAGTLALIYTTTIPYVVFAYKQHSYLRSGYFFCLAILTVGRITTMFARHSDESDNASHFRLDCVWLGLLALAPAIQALCQPGVNPPSLAINLVRLTGWNLLGAVCYLARVPESLGVVGNWKPSLYIMHLLLVFNNIWYAQGIWDFMA